MQGLNRIYLLGYLGNDPYKYQTTTGRPYTGLSIATTRKNYGAEEGESKETTDWHFVRVWGKQAESCVKYLTKGQPVMVEGYLSQYSQQKEGSEETERKVGINATRVDFLPRTNSSVEQN